MNLKQQAANRALTFVQDGMILGLGTGSTTTEFVKLLGAKLLSSEIKNVVGVPTSARTAHLAREAGIPLAQLSDLSPQDALPRLDLAVDGADEIDPRLNLIKGLGRALLREKIIESHADTFIVIADETKIVPRLGRGPLPVEIVQFEYGAQLRWFNSLGCRAELWLEEDGEPVITGNGNYLVRCWFENGIPDPHQLARIFAEQPGVIEHGLFLDMADTAIIAGDEGILVKER
jgi:ribose 5-phosphate isomerase A